MQYSNIQLLGINVAATDIIGSDPLSLIIHSPLLSVDPQICTIWSKKHFLLYDAGTVAIVQYATCIAELEFIGERYF